MMKGVRSNYRLMITLVFLSLFIPGRSLYGAEDSLCARVRIEIKQEMTLERQAFDAHMKITNGLSHISLENIKVDVMIKDSEGNNVRISSDPDDTDSLFFVRVDSLTGINDVNGGGAVLPESSADIHWLIIPAPGSAEGSPEGALYYVGARLSYKVGGDEQSMEVSPDYIVVKSMPEITLDYFLPYEVYGDDPFTPEKEEPIPFPLGVMVTNNGYGIARDLKIKSAQPVIVDNEQGLLVDFKIIGSMINGEEAQKSLLIDFGDIGPGKCAVARWDMTASLCGRFVEFDADFSHADELGGEMTSLIKEVNTHTLIKDVLVDMPGRDGIRDFLARDGDAMRVYESDRQVDDVVDLSGSCELIQDNGNYTIQCPVSTGAIFIRIEDPFSGQKALGDVIRSDGKRIRPENVWLSREKQVNTWRYYVNIFDTNTTGQYVVCFGKSGSDGDAPVFDDLGEAYGVEGENLSFTVRATDSDGEIPSLSASQLPAGAVFQDNEDGTGRFSWIPQSGQAGSYRARFIASDGIHDTSMDVSVIIVAQGVDTDSDGMTDSWEIRYFGNLERDGSGDYDGDGITDLEEFLVGSNPTIVEHIPVAPSINFPSIGEDISSSRPILSINNSTDADGDTLTYSFELSSVSDFSCILFSRENIPEGASTTSCAVSADLEDNTIYYWRARAWDGLFFSDYCTGSFFVNMQNDPPSPPAPFSPPHNAHVDTLTPVLSIINSNDPDQDHLTYEVELLKDIPTGATVFEIDDQVEGQNSITEIKLSEGLEDNTRYWWRARARDEHGLVSAWSGLSCFIVDTQEEPPTPPSILYPDKGAEIQTKIVQFEIENSHDPDFDDLSYLFELDTADDFTGPGCIRSGPVEESSGSITTWNPGKSLEDNRLYYLRVRAYDGRGYSPWSGTSFFINTQNDPPSSPVPLEPVDKEIDDASPVLKTMPADDPDMDSLEYLFEIYNDPDLTDLVSSGESNGTSWQVDTSLSSGRDYYWRVKAKDEHGLEGEWSQVARFTVSGGGLDPPVLNSPPDGGRAFTRYPVLSVVNSKGASTYLFELYSDKALNNLIESGQVRGGPFLTFWIPRTGLEDGKTYYWRCRALSGKNTSPWMDTASFAVDTELSNLDVLVIVKEFVSHIIHDKKILKVIRKDCPIHGTVLEIYPDSLEEDLEISIGYLLHPPGLPSGIRCIGPYINLGPDGARFNKPIKVIIPISREYMSMFSNNNGSPVILTLNRIKKRWDKIRNVQIDEQTSTMMFEAEHFSVYVPGFEQNVQNSGSDLSGGQSEETGGGVISGGAGDSGIGPCLISRVAESGDETVVLILIFLSTAYIVLITLRRYREDRRKGR